MPKDAYGLEVHYHARNVAIVKAALKDFAEKDVKIKILNMLKIVAQRLVDMVDDSFLPFNHPLPHDGNGQFPVWVGQMHDATGVGIYDDGKTVYYLPTKKALDSQPQWDGAHNDFHIIGNERLRNAISDGATMFSRGLWIVLYCAVPYANIVNIKGSPWNRGKGFFDGFSIELFEWVTNGLTAIKT